MRQNKKHSWRGIGQRLSPRTTRAWWRRIRAWGGSLGAAGLVAAIVFGVYRLATLQVDVQPEPADWTFKTDGSLKAAFFEKMLEPKLRKGLMQIDLVRLKTQIEHLEQVRTAHVTRVFPKTLAIEVTEHKPAFRLAAQEGSKQKTPYLVSEEGLVFLSKGLKRKDFLRLPVLRDVQELQGKAPAKGVHICGLPTLLALREALENHKNIFSIKELEISCRRFFPKTPDDPRCVLYLKSPRHPEVTLALCDFPTQLKHLQQLLDYSTQKRLAFKHIDLSISSTQATAL